MRIVFTGTHGVGKSTLGKLLSKKIKYPLVDNIARSILKNYESINVVNGVVASTTLKSPTISTVFGLAAI